MQTFDRLLGHARHGLRATSGVASLVRRMALCLQPLLHGGKLLAGRQIILHVPVRCNGCGQVTIEDSVKLGYFLAPLIGNGQILLQARNKDSLIKIGAGTAFSNNVSVIACKAVIIGKECLIGDQVGIFDSDFHHIPPSQRHTGGGKSAIVEIGNNVWIGSRAMVLKGVSIGSGSVIAAGAIVVQSVPENVLVAGVPAKLVRKI